MMYFKKMHLLHQCFVAALFLSYATHANGHAYSTKFLLLNRLKSLASRMRNLKLGNLYQDVLGLRSYGTLKMDPEILQLEGRGNVSGRCQENVLGLLSALEMEQESALRMIDSFGKPKAGILDGALNWLGSYDECINTTMPYVYINNTTNMTSSINGKYCRVGIPVLEVPLPQLDVAKDIGLTDFLPGDLVLGVCVPDTCSQHDVLLLAKIVLENAPGNISQHYHVEKVICQEGNAEIDEKARIAVIILAVLVGFLVSGTIYDVCIVQQLYLNKVPEYVEVVNGSVRRESLDDMHNEYTPLLGKRKYEIKEALAKAGSLFGKVLVSFSIYTNGRKLFNTQCTSDTLTCVYGIRLFSMTWIILGHSYMNECLVSDNALPYLNSLMKRWTYQVLLNCSVSVDTFFLLSGFLLCYLTMKELKKVGGPLYFKWILFYFHRFWRLSPTYYLVLLTYMSLVWYTGSGPDWPQNSVDKNCDKYWWRNALYINNFFPAGEMCMGWSWYLANDVQFFVLSPVLLIVLYCSECLGIILCSSVLVMNCVTSGVISSLYDLPPSPLGGGQDMSKAYDYQNVYYYKPYCRVGPYVVGLMTGYLLYKNNGQLNISKILNVIGWFVATASCLAVVYCLYDTYNGHPDDRITAAIYNALHRSVWALGVSWVIISCSSGSGGLVNSFLSWKPFIPLSRLTYGVYLVHLVLINIHSWSQRRPAYLTDITMVYTFLGHLVLSFALALVVTLAIESPFISLEKLLIKKNKK